VHKLGTAAACAVKRVHLDVRVVRAAQRAGANLMEKFEVGTDVGLDKGTGLWTVKSTDVSRGGEGGSGMVLNALCYVALRAG
jgi:hypothetical protein